jgi:DNA mismatch endonuclease, patch repair protein
MADVFTKAKRSEVMSKIRGKGNKDTEVALAKLFRANGITGWRRHYPIEGKPDFAFPKHKLAVFVDGCFWHGCPKHGVQPKGNKEFWLTKLEANKARDRKVNRLLRSSGWHVLRIWEHDLTKLRRHVAQNRIVRTLMIIQLKRMPTANSTM